MAAGTQAIEKYSIKKDSRKTASQQLTAVGDATDWVACNSDTAIQVTGVATAVTAIVERSATRPTVGAVASPVGDPITGNPSTGIQVGMYYEPSLSWWRVRLTAITGASVVVSISTSGE